MEERTPMYWFTLQWVTVTRLDQVWAGSSGHVFHVSRRDPATWAISCSLPQYIWSGIWSWNRVRLPVQALVQIVGVLSGLKCYIGCSQPSYCWIQLWEQRFKPTAWNTLLFYCILWFQPLLSFPFLLQTEGVTKRLAEKNDFVIFLFTLMTSKKTFLQTATLIEDILGVKKVSCVLQLYSRPLNSQHVNILIEIKLIIEHKTVDWLNFMWWLMSLCWNQTAHH